jgi:hypothetical protein
MFLVRLAVVAAFGIGLAVPLGAQVPRRPREQQVAALPRFMVSNPYVTSAGDSAAAVQVGTGIRDKMTKITDGEYNVLTQDQMNEALKQYGYPPNAILSPSLASTLAKSVQARILLSSSMSRAGGSQYGVQARLAARWPISSRLPSSPCPMPRAASTSAQPSRIKQKRRPERR